MVFGAEKTAVCAGYSHLFKEMCKEVGIECKYVTGAARTSFSNILFFNWNHAWNIVKLDGAYYGMDVTWIDGAGWDWAFVDPDRLIYTHFADSKDDRHTSEYVSLDSASHLLYIKAPGTKKINTNDFFPNTSLVFCKDQFTCTFPLSFRLSAVSTFSETIIDITFQGEPSSDSQSYSSQDVKYTITKANGKNQVNVPLNKLITPLELNITGVGSVNYLAINGSREDLLRHFIKSVNRQHKNDFARAILACVILRDKNAYRDILGEDLSKAIKFEDILKSEHLQAIDAWDIITWGGIFNMRSDEEIVGALKFTSKGHKINFTKRNGNYIPVSFELDAFYSSFKE